MANQQNPEQDAEDVVDIYCDSMNISTSLYTALLTFGELRMEHPTIVRARIKVSPQMLKAVSLLTSKHVRAYEEKMGQKIKLPNDVLHEWGLEEEIE